MDVERFRSSPTGRLLPTTHGLSAFVPNPLPPTLALDSIRLAISNADRAIGRLEGRGATIPNPYLLVRPLQRREAIASSNIEGTFASLSDLLRMEAGLALGIDETDTREVFNYIRALDRGLDLLETLPISNRLICQIHAILLADLPPSRTGGREPGVFRSEQNFIGARRGGLASARFVPPPPPLHIEAMGALERFMNSSAHGGLSPVVFLALAHYQFETIHPFPDGNGRVGRALIPLLLKAQGVMDTPLLYLSPYLERNREDYIDLMFEVSAAGAWLAWIEFFAEAVTESASRTIKAISLMEELRKDYFQRCQRARSSALLIKIVDQLFERPIITAPEVRDLCAISSTAAENNIKRLIEFGIVTEPAQQTYPRSFVMSGLIDLLED